MTDTHAFALFPTALGHCGIAWGADARITGVQLPEATEAATYQHMQHRYPGSHEGPAPDAITQAMVAITALLAGHPTEPVDLTQLDLDMSGVPPFHQRVYALARQIPPGETLTYGDLARQLGEPGAARAVGQALGANPFAPVVPCHRILAAQSGGGGFSAPGGVATKLRMLQIEKARFGGPGLFDD
ncbi:MAG: methylated-DNA--[protein]-cysteine S-methyltransferase [Rhodoferax sp.]|nr:methylated-DNA--[protein]-cysteine S-methyltransferase [Rhodoferax sp.]